MLDFLLLGTRPVLLTATSLQLLPRQLIEKCCVAWRILILPLCGHSRNGVVYLCQFAHFCVRLPVGSLFTNTASRASVFFQPHHMLFCNSFNKSEVKDYM